jgi:predicted acylesterase/phospholipase RssA
MIYTLYSFKGGVGRSMALANLAECFYARGLSVLMVDWDLEAPGLESYFFSNPLARRDPESAAALKASTKHLGLLDLLREYKQTYPQIATDLALQEQDAKQPTIPVGEEFAPVAADVQSEESETSTSTAPLDQDEDFYLPPHPETPVSVRPRTYEEILDEDLPRFDSYLQTIHNNGSKEMTLLSAGSRSPETFGDYAGAVQEFDWLEFLSLYEGRKFIEWLRARFSKLADVVLIDSRTGVTEMGGVCTRQLADAVIAFCAPNDQNLEGVATIADSFDTESAKKARFDRDLKLLIIPTRIDFAESDKLTEFGIEFSDKVETEKLLPDFLQTEIGERPFWGLQIPYIPRFNYREQRVLGEGAATLDEASAKLVQAYSKIALHMALLAPANSALRLAYASEIAEAYPYLDRTRVPQMAPADLPGWIERPAETEALLRSLITAAGPRRSTALWGFAGTGKSALAAHVSRLSTVLHTFPDGVLWISLEKPWSDAAIQEWFRVNLGLRKREVANLAETLSERRFLFILDDVTDTDQLEPILKYTKSAVSLILTRDLGVASAGHRSVVTVGDFTRQQIAGLLQPPPRPVVLPFEQLFDEMRLWPLGFSLIRVAFERLLALNNSEAAAWDELLGMFRAQRLAAFDEPESRNRATSAIECLGQTIRGLDPKDRTVLSVLVQAHPNDKLPEEVTLASRRRLCDLGLITNAYEPEVHPLVRAWLQNDNTTAGPHRRADTIDRKEVLRKAKEAVEKGETFEELRSLAKKASGLRSFSLARRLYEMARAKQECRQLSLEEQIELAQKHAICTYKDDDLPPDRRFTSALALLKEGDPKTMAGGETDGIGQETLGLAGSIYKRRWYLTGARADLLSAHNYYRRGAVLPIEGDFGYTRINAAFILDILASLDREQDPEAAINRAAEAARYREEVITELPKLALSKKHRSRTENWWYGATLAEACFAQDRQPEARFWLRQALALGPNDWELESTARQMVALFRTRRRTVEPNSPEWQTLSLIMGQGSAIQSMMTGKTGLALSGGGFRASLFHIGVLARLADIDVLRHIEVLSCVSGGSVIGAYLYLEIKTLLERKADADITAQDYIDLVARIERDFLAGVQRNVRGRMLAGWWANLKTLFVPGYTRTLYLGQLFERFFYRKAARTEKPLWLNDLKIHPQDESKDFLPRLDNWRRAAKAPVLLLNATTLNTGHNWQFAVSWMGEPALAAGGVDSNDLLRRMYYDEAPPRYRKIRLGEAVVASACVPALFDPIEFSELYPGRTVRLVDGGVHDNQGTSGLLEQECTAVLVSDASGQMNSDFSPSAEIVSVPLRANDILMARVREAEFRQLRILERATALSSLMYLHLKEGLSMKHIDWLDCRDPYKDPPPATTPGSDYGVPLNARERLAGLRTDFDAFSDAEAHALMLSGYRLTEECIPKLPIVGPAIDHPSTPWTFLGIAPVVAGTSREGASQSSLFHLLEIGAGRTFKAWKQPSARIRIIPQLLLALVPPVLLLILFVRAIPALMDWLHHFAFYPAHPCLDAAIFAVCVLILAASAVTSGRKSATALVTGFIMVTVGWFFARLHLWIVDPAFLHAGRLDLGARTSAKPARSSGSGMVRNLAWLLPLAILSYLLFIHLLPKSPFTIANPAPASGSVDSRDTQPIPNSPPSIR